MTARTSTPAQRAQQRNRRRNGQYEKLPPCDLCGKGCSDQDYAAVPWIDREVTDGGITWAWGDAGIFLHHGCAETLENMGPTAAWKRLHDGAAPTAR